MSKKSAVTPPQSLFCVSLADGSFYTASCQADPMDANRHVLTTHHDMERSSASTSVSLDICELSSFYETLGAYLDTINESADGDQDDEDDDELFPAPPVYLNGLTTQSLTGLLLDYTNSLGAFPVVNSFTFEMLSNAVCDAYGYSGVFPPDATETDVNVLRTKFGKILNGFGYTRMRETVDGVRRSVYSLLELEAEEPGDASDPVVATDNNANVANEPVLLTEETVITDSVKESFPTLSRDILDNAVKELSEIFKDLRFDAVRETPCNVPNCAFCS